MLSTEIANILNAQHLGPESEINAVVFDSRQVLEGNQILFTAIKTPSNDGHRYIPELIEKGLRVFMVELEYQIPQAFLTTHTWIRVKDVLHHLHVWAEWKRNQFKGLCIAIAGSQGKTMVKEWLYQLLKQDYSMVRSPRSFNSQLGVALSLLRIEPHHNLALLEAGISKPNEMQALERLIRPDLVVYTSFGSPHDEGFENRHQKSIEKLKLAIRAKAVIANQIQRPNNFKGQWIQIDKQGAVSYEFNEPSLKLVFFDKSMTFQLPFKDEVSVRNCVTCITVMLHLNYSTERIQARIMDLRPVSIRLEVKQGWGNSILVNDFYNADLESLEYALQFLIQQPARSRTLMIVSDLEQSGLDFTQRAQYLQALCRRYALDYCIMVGSSFLNPLPAWPCEYKVFSSTQELLNHWQVLSPLFSQSRILLKAARSYNFEILAQRMQIQSHATVFQVNLSRLRENLTVFKSQLLPGVKIMGMVKAMAYGSGGIEIAHFLQQSGVEYLAVAYTDEGVSLRQSGITRPIMVMNPGEDNLEELLFNQLEPEIFSIRILKKWIEVVDYSDAAEVKIHIKLDTGMHRLGFLPEDLETLLSLLKAHPKIKVASVFSHFKASEQSALDSLSQIQLERFNSMQTSIIQALGYPVLRHMANTQAILRLPNSQMDMVRLGIGLYGLSPLEGMVPVCKWFTRISQIRWVNAGESIGYGHANLLDQPTRIATLPIGYADGLSRALGHGKHGVYIQNKFCKILGSVCMDMLMVDLGSLNAQEGDEAVIFETIEQLENLAKAMQTIPYEVLTSISSRVKRVYTID